MTQITLEQYNTDFQKKTLCRHLKRIYFFDLEEDVKMIHCHQFEGIGLIWPVKGNKSRLVYARIDNSKYFDVGLSTVPLTVRFEKPFKKRIPKAHRKGPDTSGTIWNIQLEGKPAKSAFVR